MPAVVDSAAGAIPRVAVTRSAESALALAVALDNVGLTPLITPLLRIAYRDSGALAERLAVWAEYDWIACTSRHAVEALAQACVRANVSVHLLGMLRVAAVGGATASALASLGIPVSVVPEEADAEHLAQSLLDTHPLPGARVLFPRAADARDVLPTVLRAQGLAVDEVVVYDTLPCPEGATTLVAALSQNDLAAVTLASGSAARAFATMVDRALWSRTKLVSIGPTTTDVAHSLGLVIAAEADAPSVGALAMAARRTVLDSLTHA